MARNTSFQRITPSLIIVAVAIGLSLPACSTSSPAPPSPTNAPTRAATALPRATSTHSQTSTPKTTSTYTPAPEWDRYVPTTLAAVIEENREVATHEITGIDLFPGKPYRVDVTYQGDRRPLDPSRGLLWHMWVTTLGPPEQTDLYLALYEEEVQFLDGTAVHWMPVQSVLVPYMENELDEGDLVTLYVNWIGVNHDAATEDWVFWVNEFRSH